MSYNHLQTILLSLIFGGTALLFAILFYFDRKGKKQYLVELNQPDWNAIEQFLGNPVPQALKELYADKTLINSQFQTFDLSNPLTKENDCYIAYFEPISLNKIKFYMSEKHGRRQGLILFASNGGGDEYLLDPKKSDPDVVYLVHGGEMGSLGISLSKFLNIPHRIVTDDD